MKEKSEGMYRGHVNLRTFVGDEETGSGAFVLDHLPMGFKVMGF